MLTPTALLRAKHTIAAGVVAAAMASMVHPATTVAAAAPQSTRIPTITVPHIELTASVTTDGSTQQVGVADAYLYTLDQTQLVSQLNEIRSLGVTDLRIVVPWIYIQPTSSSTYNWAQMDNVINTAHSMGFNLTASITGNPVWDGTPLIGAPNPTSYATFAAAVAQRYAGQVSAYEVLNEPNAVEFMAPADPAVYTAILKAAYSAIKAVQPSATVIAGVLASLTTVPGLSVAPDQFVAQMYAAGAKGFFDALSFHPYSYQLPFSAGVGIAGSPLEQVEAMYALMVANGDAAKQIWATEYGNPTQPGGVTQTQQAQMLQDFVTAWSKLSFAGPAFVYTAADLNSGFLLDENNLGLFTTSGLPKLAAQTLATLITQLATGTLPNYTAPLMPVAQSIWIQVVSLAMSVANEALLIPNIATQAIYNTLPAPLQQAFSAVANAVSLAAGTALTMVTPVAVGAIDTVITAGPNIANAAAAINSAVLNAGAAVNAGVQGAILSVGTAAHNTELTVAAAVQQLTAAAAALNPAGPTTVTANPVAATATSATASTTAKPTASESTSTTATTATAPAVSGQSPTTTTAAADTSVRRTTTAQTTASTSSTEAAQNSATTTRTTLSASPSAAQHPTAATASTVARGAPPSAGPSTAPNAAVAGSVSREDRTRSTAASNPTDSTAGIPSAQTATTAPDIRTSTVTGAGMKNSTATGTGHNADSRHSTDTAPNAAENHH